MQDYTRNRKQKEKLYLTIWVILFLGEQIDDFRKWDKEEEVELSWIITLKIHLSNFSHDQKK